MKRILFLLIIFLSGLISEGYKNYPFDWSDHFGVITQNGSVMWNEDWMSGVLFFDGTFNYYPKRFGSVISNNIVTVQPGYFLKEKTALDSSYEDSHIKYTQGDYFLDMLDLTANFSDGMRLITWNGFKKTYGGPNGQYILGTVKPIQQAYCIKYQTGQINVTIGHFITSSGIPDTSTNGSMNDRILNASIQIHGSAGNWNWQLHGSQFNQKYKIQHSSWGMPRINYLTRTRIQGKLIRNFSEDTRINAGFEGNIQGLSNSSIFRSRDWGMVFAGIAWQDFTMAGGAIAISNGMAPYYQTKYQKQNTQGGMVIEVNNKPKPMHMLFWSGNKDSLAFENWQSLSFNTWKSIFQLTFHGKIFLTHVQEINQYQINSDLGRSISKAEANIRGGEIGIIWSGFRDWVFSGSFRHVIEPSIITDGIGDWLDFRISGKEKIFKRNMNVSFTVGLTGWLNRDPAISFDPFVGIPLKVNDSVYIPGDRWILQAEVAAKVASLSVTWRINNVFRALQPMLDIIPEEESWISTNYLMHDEQRQLGRLMEIVINWYFQD